MLESEFHISKLITGHFQGRLNTAEEAELKMWIKASSENQSFFNEFQNEQYINEEIKKYQSGNSIALWNETIGKIQAEKVPDKNIPVKKLNTFRYKVAAAAILLMVLSAGIYFYSSQFVNGTKTIVYHNDIAPGKNTAILTLSNGHQISLSDAVNGKLAEEAGVKITKTADGQLIYTVKNGRSTPTLSQRHLKSASEYNTMTTPRGSQWQVNLPDGTNVWLNAVSSLKYPLSFTGNVRKVELSGEAYFEVAKDKKHPFVVMTNKQKVEVLGTHFNINAYADENSTKTTLLEGTVRIVTLNSVYPEYIEGSKGKMLRRPSASSGQHDILQAQDNTVLKPGQQSILTGNAIEVRQIDPESAIAWKNGNFVFERENIESIMRKVARWYSAEIVYNGERTKELYSGITKRSSHVSQILSMLEKTGTVGFQIEGNKIIVSKINN